MPDVVIVGGGQNGLVCGCYLARAGLDVMVVEQSEAVGGGSRTEETVSGYRFDTHSVAHNIINMTDIVDELDLPAAGLDYIEMDPFAVGVFADGAIIRGAPSRASRRWRATAPRSGSSASCCRPAPASSRSGWFPTGPAPPSRHLRLTPLPAHPSPAAPSSRSGKPPTISTASGTPAGAPKD